MVRRRAVFAMWLVLGAGLSPALAAETPAPSTAPTARTADEWAAVASQQLKDGDRDAAIKALQAAVKTDPAHGSAGLLITTLHQAGRIEEAYALGERYHREGPRNPRALFRYGWLLAFIGEVDRAEPLFRDLIALDKGGIYEAWGNGELAYLARARGDARGAVAFMERAVAARPADMISRVGRAHMMVEAGDARAAVPLLEAELAANPAARGYGAVPASLVLGWALRLSGDDDAAARWLDPLEAELFTTQANATVRQLGMEPMNAARQLAYLAVRGRREEALQLAARMPTLPLYGAPDPHDGMFASLVGAPEYEALLKRARDAVDAERQRLGMAPLRRVR
jgi:tetratricopeptide (TPR) repeat protein